MNGQYLDRRSVWGRQERLGSTCVLLWGWLFDNIYFNQGIICFMEYLISTIKDPAKRLLTYTPNFLTLDFFLMRPLLIHNAKNKYTFTMGYQLKC